MKNEKYKKETYKNYLLIINIFFINFNSQTHKEIKYYFMKKSKNSTANYNYFCYFHLHSAHLILLSTLAFLRRRKEMISTEDKQVSYTDIPKERGVVLILVMQ
jgi:hypothetical protein